MSHCSRAFLGGKLRLYLHWVTKRITKALYIFNKYLIYKIVPNVAVIYWRYLLKILFAKNATQRVDNLPKFCSMLPIFIEIPIPGKL